MNQNEKMVMTLVFVATAIVIGVIWKFASTIGADFEITLNAVMKTTLVVAICGFVYNFIRPRPIKLITGALIVAWPMWWGVVDSIAYGGGNNSQEMIEIVRATTGNVWWNSLWFKGGIEVFGIIAAVIIFFKPGR